MTTTETPSCQPGSEKQTTVGNYFVSNYPPFSFWKPEFVPELVCGAGTAAGARHAARRLSAHSFLPEALPFLLFQSLYGQGFRRHSRLHRAALQELALYAAKPVIGGRKANFVYFGGGTPSYLSVDQLRHLTDGMKKLISWDEAEEVTFECEPGTLTEPQAQGHSRNGRDAPEPGRGEF